jgi:hypothetical protein
MSNRTLPVPPRVTDLTGRVFSRLTVVGYSGKDRNGNKSWLVSCECGAAKVVKGGDINSGRTTSCGCFAKERASQSNSKHGMSESPEYRTWAGMWTRCEAPSQVRLHPEYAARKPPDVWRDFSVFYAELGPKPTPDHTLDRIDNEKPYGPGNCRWALRAEQSRNTCRNVWVMTPEGQRLVLKDACSEYGLDYVEVTLRLSRVGGQSVEAASNGLFQEAA